MKNKKVFSLLLLFVGFGFLVGLPFKAEAGFFKSSNDPWVRHSDTVEENLYLAGANVSSKGTVKGDLIAAGGNITSHGSTSEDLMLAGGTLSITGSIGGDARLAAGTVNISGPVGGDLIIFGGNIFVGSDSVVESDLMMAGGQISFEGEAQKRLQVSGGDVFLDGTIEGDAKIRASQLELGPNTQIKGDLTYSAPQEAKISEDAKVEGEIDYTKKTKTSAIGGAIIFENLRNFLSALKVVNLFLSLISALVVVLVFSNFSKKLAKRGIAKLGKNILIGFATLVAVPVATFVLFASLVGSMFGFLILVLYLAFIILAQIVTGIIVGALLSTTMNDNPIVNWQWTIAGVALIWLLGLVPIVGWFIVFLSFLLTLGTLSALAYRMVVKSEES